MLRYVFLFVVGSIYLFWRFIENKKSRLELPPELPKKLPIIGHAHILMGNSLHLFKALKWVSYQSLENGGIVTMSLGQKTAFVITDPDDFLTVANTCLVKDYYYCFTKAWLGDGLFSGSGPTWKRHRKTLTPAFNQVVLDKFMGVFNRRSRHLVSQLNKEVGKGPFPHSEYLAPYTLELVIETVFGITEYDSSFHKKYIKSIENIHEIFTERLQKFWLHNDFIYNMTNLKRREDTNVEVLHKMSNAVIKKQRLLFNQQKLCNKSNTNKFKPFIDLIFEIASTGETFTDKEIRDEVNTFVVAGSDTCGVVLTFVLLTIGSYPKVQERMYKELCEVLGDFDKDIEKSDLSKLVYMEAVIKETLRLYPIGPVITRYTDTKVQLKNYTVPADSNILLLIWGVHRHSIWGPDVNQFKPERWLDRSTLPKYPHAFVAFSTGKRNCIGYIFAMMTMKTTLSYILKRYRIMADLSKLKLKIDVLLKPAEGGFVSLELRQ